MFFYMKVLSTLLCLLLLHQNASAKGCPAGKKFDYKLQYCVDCPENYYNPKSGQNIHCKLCSECGKGSKVVDKCTPTTDIRCKCKEGFTPIDHHNEICVCKKGSEVDKTGDTCSKCRTGYFSDKDDSTCQKWRQCKSGIEILGTETSDNICKNASEEVVEVSPKMSTASMNATSQKTTPISSAGTSRTPSPTKDRFYSLWPVMLCAIILLLFGLLYYKCKVINCIYNHKKVDSRKDSVCRKPVEESGDKCLSLLV